MPELEHEREAYFAKMDQYGKFINEYFVLGDNEKVQRAYTYLAYQKYMNNNGFNGNDYTKQNLFKYLEDKFKLSKIQGVMYFKGLRSKTDEEMQVDEENVNDFTEESKVVESESESESESE